MDPERFIADWEKPGPHADVVTASSVKLGAPITTFIMFRNCKADADWQCNLTVGFAVYDVKGKAVLQAKDAPAWVAPPPPRDMIFLTTANVTVGFEKSDPTGAYRFVATTTDHVAKVTAVTEQTIKVEGL